MRGPWHWCADDGATTTMRAASRAELEARMREQYPAGIPAWLGEPCERPFPPRASHHAPLTADELTEDAAIDAIADATHAGQFGGWVEPTPEPTAYDPAAVDAFVAAGLAEYDRATAYDRAIAAAMAEQWGELE